MKSSFTARQPVTYPSPLPAEFTASSTERDFTTLDGRIVPRALGELALCQHTALLIGGLLIGEWPEHI
ncbi:MAG: hypothetical protein ACRYF0_00045 [Janthinobacterium lividum]